LVAASVRLTLNAWPAVGLGKICPVPAATEIVVVVELMDASNVLDALLDAMMIDIRKNLPPHP
jgi:hypothetical protein